MFYSSSDSNRISFFSRSDLFILSVKRSTVMMVPVRLQSVPVSEQLYWFLLGNALSFSYRRDVEMSLIFGFSGIQLPTNSFFGANICHLDKNVKNEDEADTKMSSFSVHFCSLTGHFPLRKFCSSMEEAQL